MVIKPLKPNPKQAEYLISLTEHEHTVVGMRGGAGAGKTQATCQAIREVTVTIPGNKVCIARKFRKDIGPTIWQEFISTIDPRLVEEIKKSEQIVIMRTVVPGEFSEIHFLGLDDMLRWGSKSFAQIFVEEASETSKDEFIYMTTRLRHHPKDVNEHGELVNRDYLALYRSHGIPVSPFIRKDGSIHRFISLAYNPPENRDHYLIKLAAEGTINEPGDYPSKIIKVSSLDNYKNLDQSYKEILDKLPERDRRRMRDGEDSEGFDGTPAISSFDEDYQVFQGKIDPEELEIYAGVDFGWQHPCIVYGTVKNSCLYIWAEYFGSQIDLDTMLNTPTEVPIVEQKFNKFAMIVNFVDHQHGLMHSDKNKKTSIQLMRDLGRTVRHSYSRPEERALGTNILCRQRRLFVHESCDYVIKTLRAGWARDEDGELIKDNYWEHVADAIGYLVWGLFQHQLRKLIPKKLGKRKEAHSKMIKEQLKQAKEKPKSFKEMQYEARRGRKKISFRR